MAPRKRAASSSSTSRKSNQIQQPSQPSKFGIQHFFDRHSQSQAASAAAAAPKNTDPKPSSSPVDPQPPITAVDTEDPPPQITPEIRKSVPSKRFKFSPGMLIKQSQDDGGDEITWKISPVNERLKSIKSNHLPGMMRVLPEAPRPTGSCLQPCTKQNSSSCSVGKLEKWLSSPTITGTCRLLAPSRVASIQELAIYDGCGSIADGNTVSKLEFRSPFRTPPSTSYGPSQLSTDAGACSGASDDLTTRQHRKALLELLDQVEDAISDEALTGNSMQHDVCDTTDDKVDMEHDPLKRGANGIRSRGVYDTSHYMTFLVLEVSEKHSNEASSRSQSSFKVLRLLDELSGQERALHLYDNWFYCSIGPGDTVNVIGEFDEQGKCVVSRDANLVIVHPDVLISGTRVASSFICSRRTVLDERLKSSEYSTSALVGTLLHQIFQAGLLNDMPTRRFLEEYAATVLQKNIENLYACGANENDIYLTLIEAVPKILNWLRCFKKAEDGCEDKESTSITFASGEKKNVHVTEVIDIEEMAWAPRYGIKGMIDASVRIKMSTQNGGSHETIMPLEFKTGKVTSGQSANEHRAQVTLYTLLMSERYQKKKDIDAGLLYYLHTDETQVIEVQRANLVGIVMRRNELATELLKSLNSQILPPMLQSLPVCRRCRHLDICTLYHKADGGYTESSGLGNMFDELAGHLTDAHSNFLKHWNKLIDLEAKVSQVSKKEILRRHNLREERSVNSLSSMILDPTMGFLVDGSVKNGRFVYYFLRQKPQRNYSEMHIEEKLNPIEIGAGRSNGTLKCGDYVILSTESGDIAVANGVICDISHFHISVSFPRRLRLPRSDPSPDSRDLLQEFWQIDKDEVASSYGIMRFNLVQLFVQGSLNTHLRKMIVDLVAPRFDSGGMFSQDPAISYIRSEKSLNSDQRRAIHKILAAKDYTLILGMPGTGKTSTMVHAVKALLMRGASILLTAYTNSAVDNLLIKLKAQNIDFIRIGRQEAIHDDVREHCFSAMGTLSVDDIKHKVENARVVGVTCLGITSPLLANKKFDVCIMDEAGQTTLPVSLGPLMLASTFVLVGDHYQLPPLVQSTEAREKGMSISLFCRLSEAYPQAISALQSQYRMCTGIMELSNALIYGKRLRCGSSEIANAKLMLSNIDPIALWLKEALDPNMSVIFIDTDQLPAPEVKEHGSMNNPSEAYIVSEITKGLVQRNVSGNEIGIITPYNSQASLIQSIVGASVEIHTIDKYQGRDKDCILISFVRSSVNSRTCSSSLLGDWHRINVALTRAKKKLIMVGSCGTLSKVPLLKLLIEKVHEMGGVKYVVEKDIPQLKRLKKCSKMSVE